MNKFVPANLEMVENEFGHTGDPNRVSQTIHVKMSDEMKFEPSAIRIKAGVTIRFVVENPGEILHEMVLGRTEEPPGTLTSALRVERADAVLCHNELRVGDGAEGWAGPAGLGGARVVVTEVAVGPGRHETTTALDGATRAGLLGLAPGASLRVALGVSLGSALALLADLG